MGVLRPLITDVNGCKRSRLVETALRASSCAIDVTPARTAALPDGTVVGIEGPCGRLNCAYQVEMGCEELLEGAT